MSENILGIRVELGNISDTEDGGHVRFEGLNQNVYYGSKEWAKNHVLPVSINEDLPTENPSVSNEMVEHFIKEIYTSTVGEKTTIVRAVLRNGFEIVESSSCVSKENYSEGLGKKICMEKICDKIWMLLGFLLQTAVTGFNWEAEK